MFGTLGARNFTQDVSNLEVIQMHLFTRFTVHVSTLIQVLEFPSPGGYLGIIFFSFTAKLKIHQCFKLARNYNNIKYVIGSKKRGTFCAKCNSFQTVTILRPQEPSASDLGCEQLRHFSNTLTISTKQKHLEAWN